MAPNVFKPQARHLQAEAHNALRLNQAPDASGPATLFVRTDRPFSDMDDRKPRLPSTPRKPASQTDTWKRTLLMLGVIAAIGLSIYGVARLDTLLDDMQWHWMTPKGSSEAGSPVIHWQGR